MSPMKKKFLCLLMTIALLSSMLMPVYATEQATCDEIQTGTYNEYDYICSLKALASSQTTTSAINQLCATEIENFELAFSERANLPDDTLRELGYSNAEIQLLRRYAAGEILSAAEMRQATASCNGYINRVGLTEKVITVQYRWVWDKCPTQQKTDAAALRWCVYDKQGHRIDDVVCSYKTAYVHYYRGDENTYVRNATFQTIQDFNAVNAQFPMSYGGYGKTGCIKVSISLPDSVDNKINAATISASYGHTVKNSAAPTISLAYPWSLSITFTQGEDCVQTMDITKVRVDSNGTTQIS